MTTAYLLSNKPLNFDRVPPMLADIYPIDETLRILGFNEKSPFGCPKRSWGQLEVMAGPWFYDWVLMFSTQWRSSNTIPVPYELRIPDKERPIILLSIIYNAWKSWFDWIEPPDDLRLGKEFGERNWEEQQREYLNRPTIWADREFFRFCVSYLDKIFDWAEEEFNVELSYVDRQLKLRIKDVELHCPARGKFNGKLTIPCRGFFRHLPKRLIGDTVFIQVIEKDKVIIGSRLLPRRCQAQWDKDLETTAKKLPPLLITK